MNRWVNDGQTRIDRHMHTQGSQLGSVLYLGFYPLGGRSMIGDG